MDAVALVSVLQGFNQVWLTTVKKVVADVTLVTTVSMPDYSTAITAIATMSTARPGSGDPLNSRTVAAQSSYSHASQHDQHLHIASAETLSTS